MMETISFNLGYTMILATAQWLIPLPMNPKTLAQTPQLSSCSAQYIVTANITEISVSTSSDVKWPAAVMAFCKDNTAVMACSDYICD